MLKTRRVQYYKVKEGQNIRDIAQYFSLSPYLLAKVNGLYEEPSAGCVLKIPVMQGNYYTVKEGDSKALLCGNDEEFEKKNGTDVFYIGMRVVL